jgi:hypothetical protein
VTTKTPQWWPWDGRWALSRGILDGCAPHGMPSLELPPDDKIGITRAERSTQPVQSRFSTGICSRGWVAGPSITSPV